jgi:hypothetical protein
MPWTVLDTPIGPLTLVASDVGLTSIRLPARGADGPDRPEFGLRRRIESGGAGRTLGALMTIPPAPIEAL